VKVRGGRFLFGGVVNNAKRGKEKAEVVRPAMGGN